MSRLSRGVTAMVAMLAVAGLVGLVGCGGGDTGPQSAEAVPGRATTSVGGEGEGVGEPTTGSPGGTTAASGSASGGGGTSGSGTTEVTLYFVRGERLAAVKRSVPRVTRIGAEAVKSLLAGPTDAERRSGMETAIPGGTQFRDLVIDANGLARVDLSRTFESGGGTLALTLRLGQVACTLDAFPTVSGVRFALDGQVVDVLSGDGIVVDEPVSCDTYGEWLETAPQPPATDTFAGIWPFATSAELAAYARSGASTYRDPVETAKAFASTYLGMASPVTFPFRAISPGLGDVQVGFGTGEGGALIANPQPTTTVRLSQLGNFGDNGPWTVTAALSPDIVVDSPKGLAPRIGPPVTVTGRARAFEGTVNVEVREDGMTAGQALGRGFVTGRGDGVLGPFSGSIGFRSPSKPAGAVVFFEKSMADGSTLRATVVRVSF